MRLISVAAALQVVRFADSLHVGISVDEGAWSTSIPDVVRSSILEKADDWPEMALVISLSTESAFAKRDTMVDAMIKITLGCSRPTKQRQFNNAEEGGKEIAHVLRLEAFPCRLQQPKDTELDSEFELHEIPTTRQQQCLSLLVRSWLDFLREVLLEEQLSRRAFTNHPSSRNGIEESPFRRFSSGEVKSICLMSAQHTLEASATVRNNATGIKNGIHPPLGATQSLLVKLGREGLRNSSMSIVSIHRPPLTLLKDDQTNQAIAATGFVIEMVFTILSEAEAREVNTIMQPYDGTFGNPTNKTNTWNGMIGMVMRGEADIGAAGFTMTSARAKIVDFTISYYMEPTSILVPPPKLQTKVFAVLKPLPFNLWAASVALIILFGFLLWSGQYFLESKAPFLSEALIRDKQFQPFMYSYAGFLSLGGREPRQSWLRIGASLPLIAGVVIGTAYNGALIAALSIPTMLPSINSLEDLASQSEILWTVQKGTSLVDLFQCSDQGVYRKIGDLIQNRPDLLVESNAEGVQKVLTGKFAFIKERSLLDSAMAQDTRETNECRLHVAKEEFFLAGFALVLPKGAPYLHYFNHQIQWMIQTGITHYWKRKYWPAKNKCEAARKEQEAQRALGIDDVQGVFLLLGIGLAASGIAFIVEISIPCIQKKGNEERKRGTTEVARRGEVTTTKPGVVSYTQRTSY